MKDIMPPINTPDSKFHDGNPLTGVQGTTVTASFLNDVQSSVMDVQIELKSILQSANIQNDETNNSQVFQAIISIIKASTYVLPVGVPIPYPASVPPENYLKCNGASFNKTLYPVLAAVYPSGVLPDLRGEFIRGLDDGRGIDSGRAILTAQRATTIGYYIGNSSGSAFVHAEYGDGTEIGQPTWSRVSATTTPTLGQTYTQIKPRNISFLYIVRAV